MWHVHALHCWQQMPNDRNSRKLKWINITKTCLYNFDPLKPHFYIVKLGFTRVYIIFLISAQKHGLWVLVRSASARRFWGVPTIYVLSKNMKTIQSLFFLFENVQILEVKFSIYLNRRVFVMRFEYHGPSQSHAIVSHIHLNRDTVLSRPSQWDTMFSYSLKRIGHVPMFPKSDFQSFYIPSSKN